jgi:hypothetical protein
VALKEVEQDSDKLNQKTKFKDRVIPPIVGCEFLRNDKGCGHTPINSRYGKQDWECCVFTCPRLHKYIRDTLLLDLNYET